MLIVLCLKYIGKIVLKFGLDIRFVILKKCFINISLKFRAMETQFWPVVC